MIAGLSPLARGTQEQARQLLTNIRFIPAGAGNTLRQVSLRALLPVYPRWRGEHLLRCYRKCAQSGLSPLPRGTRFALLLFGQTGRFIPAGAGNTNRRSFSLTMIRVYPRWRGEHIKTGVAAQHRSGLSPLARGTPVNSFVWLWYSRFIPAGAGNTLVYRRLPGKKPVYPRWRGEHSRAGLEADSNRGLSPLARGTRLACAMKALLARFIPAGAGNTADH